MKQKLVIWGASGHALVVADIIRLQGNYEIVGFLDDVNPESHGTEFCGATVLGGQDQLEVLQQKGIKHLIFGFGDCNARLRLHNLVRAKGFSLSTAIHPRAIVAPNVAIGPGTVIVAGAVVNPGSRIGENVIINTGASVDHECAIEDGVHICPGTHMGGKVTIGREAWIGIGVIIREDLSIGAQSIIGAGSLVLDNIPASVLAYGVPAKVIRKITPNGY